MPEDEALSSLIGDIYDAALDPKLWPGVLGRTCTFLDGVAAVIHGQNVVARSGQFYFAWGDDPHYTRLYFEEYIRINPLLPHFMTAQVGEIFSASQLMPLEELRASRFAREWLAPQKYVDFVGTTLEKSVTSVIAITVGRDDDRGLVDDEMRRRMVLLAPHFRRAITIGKTIDLQKIEATAFVETLDRLSAAVFLVDVDGHVVHASTAGKAMLAAEECIRTVNGVLTPVEPQPARALHDVIAASRDGDAAVGNRGIALPLQKPSGERYVAHVLPLTSGARRESGTSNAVAAAVFVRKAELDLVTPIELIAARYRLTPGEMRTLHALVETGGVPAVAQMLGITEATVKTHLHRLFQKTGARRQSDLFKLLAEHRNLFDG